MARNCRQSSVYVFRLAVAAFVGDPFYDDYQADHQVGPLRPVQCAVSPSAGSHALPLLSPDLDRVAGRDFPISSLGRLVVG